MYVIGEIVGGRLSKGIFYWCFKLNLYLKLYLEEYFKEFERRWKRYEEVLNIKFDFEKLGLMWIIEMLECYIKFDDVVFV